MVSKTAVIALVAIISIPILLGYAFNLSTVSVTEYQADGNSVNVTPLISSGDDYTTVSGSVYDLNATSQLLNKAMPFYFYQKITSTSGSLRDQQATYAAGQRPQDIGFYSGDDRFIEDVRLTVLNDTITCTLTFFSDPQVTISDVVGIRSQGDGLNVQIVTSSSTYYNYVGVTYIAISISPTYSGTAYMSFRLAPNYTQYYPDYTSGWRAVKPAITGYFNSNSLQTDLKDILMTIDLGSTTNNFNIGQLVGLQFDFTYNTTYYTVDILYNNVVKESFDLPIYNTNNSVYQFDISKSKFNAYYIGKWNYGFGKANYYLSYEHDISEYTSSMLGSDLGNVFGYNSTGLSPITKIDSATFKGVKYSVIDNATYNPALFKSNPSTTISDISVYGNSITFGGNTYTVKNGDITLFSKKIPVADMVFDSIYNSETHVYDNYINGTKVSSSATASTIGFNGKWGASVSTDANVTTTVNKTQWNVGEFGWDGMDQNFLIVGLITCLGVFVALGIYARKKGSGGLIPLMIAVGCAATVFFIML